MGTPQGGYPVPPSAPSAPSAPPAPSAYQSQQSWQQPNYSSVPSSYSSAPPSYSSAPPTLAYSSSLRYNSQNSFNAAHPPTASPYADPGQVNTTYGQTPSAYGQPSYGQTPQAPYADPSKLISTYGQAPVPSSYGQSTQPSSYGQPVPPSSYGQPQPSSYGQSQPSSYGKPASQATAYPGAQYGQTYGQPTQYSTTGSYPPTAYGNPYGQNYNQAGKPKVQFPTGTDPEIIRAFEMGDVDGSGLIDAAELGRVLSTGLPFSLRTVHLMLHLYSGNGGSKIGPTEFVSLWKSLKEWKTCFERFDRDRSGRIDFQELRDGLLSMGYAISPPLLQILISKYDRTGQAKALDYDNFVECGLVVKGLTDRFKAKDTRFTGSATLDYESFMQMVLPFIVA